MTTEAINEKERMITLQTFSGQRTVMAYPVGDHLAVNHSNGVGGPAWRITHTPTGLALPYEYDSKQAAVNAANQVSSLNWGFNNAKQIPKTLKRQCMDILGEMPDGVK